MPWIAVALNIFAAFALLFAGQVAISIHQTHAFSMYREFVIRGFLDEAALQRAAGAPEHYDFISRLRAIGGGGLYYRIISVGAALALTSNAVYLVARSLTPTDEFSPNSRNA